MTILKDNLCFISANRKGALSWPRTAATTVAAPTATIASAAAGGVVSHFQICFQKHILSWAVPQRPNSEWICELITNVTFYVHLIIDHHIDCTEINLPYNQNNTG